VEVLWSWAAGNGSGLMMTNQVQVFSMDLSSINSILFFTVNASIRRPAQPCLFGRAYTRIDHPHPRSCGPSVQLYACSHVDRGVSEHISQRWVLRALLAVSHIVVGDVALTESPDLGSTAMS
jgi:hypothetical protein